MNSKKQRRFGDRLKKQRKNKGLTQKEIESATGISQASIARIERGEQRNIRASTRDALSAYLNINGIDPIEREIHKEINRLGLMDRLTILRIILRFRHGPRQSNKRLKIIFNKL